MSTAPNQAQELRWSLLSAVVGIMAGGLLLVWPRQGTLSLTVVLIAFLMAPHARPSAASPAV